MISSAGFPASDSFQSSLENSDRQYGEVVNYTCTVVDTSGNPSNGSSIWRRIAFNCPGLVNENFIKSHGASSTCNSGAITAQSVSAFDNCFTSRLMVTVSSGTTVECTLHV